MAASSSLGRATGMRGKSLLSIRLDYLQIHTDETNPLGCTLWVWLPVQKNDVDGEEMGAFFPIYYDALDGYSCPLLALSIYLLAMRDTFEAAAAATPKKMRRDGTFVPRDIFLFPGNMRNAGGANGFDCAKPWDSADASKALSQLCRSLFNGTRSFTQHSNRKSLFARAVMRNVTTLQFNTWGGWKGSDCIKYTSQCPEVMSHIGQKLVGLRPLERPTVLPYKSDYHGSGFADLPIDGIPRLLRASTLAVEAFLDEDLDPTLSREAFILHVAKSFPPYAPLLVRYPTGRPYAPPDHDDVPAVAAAVISAVGAAASSAIVPQRETSVGGLILSHIGAAVASLANVFQGAVTATLAQLTPVTRVTVAAALSENLARSATQPSAAGAALHAISTSRSAEGPLPSVPPLTSVINAAGGAGFGNVMLLWCGKLPGFPPLSHFRSTSFWDINNEATAKAQKERFARYLCITAEITVRLLHYDGFSTFACSPQIIDYSSFTFHFYSFDLCSALWSSAPAAGRSRRLQLHFLAHHKICTKGSARMAKRHMKPFALSARRKLGKWLP